MGRLLWPSLAAAATVLVLALLPLSGAGASDSFVQPITTSAADQQLLDTVSVRPGDVRPSAVIVPYESGTTVRGQVSLDLCGADFPSEALRTGRVQVGVNEGQDQVFAVEAILYRDDAAAEQAMTELTHARKTCPKGYAPSGVLGYPPTKNRFNPVPRQYAKAVPGVQRVAFDITQRARDGSSGEVLSIYQRHGHIVVGLYSVVPVDDLSLASNIGGLVGLANTLGQRLHAAQAASATI